MDYLRIEFDNPQAVYFPGQAVTGKVILKTQESIKARFMKICIQGDASTKWQEHEHHHRTDSQGRRDSLNEHVNYGSTINYLTGESTVWSSSDGTNKIQPGVSIFPFAFSLPTNCPPSFEGCHGHIKYSVHVELDRPWKWNKHTHQLFTVVPAYDLNITPEAVNPMMNTVSKNTGLLKKGGLLVMTVNLPKRGYVPGEVIPITISIDNGSRKPIATVSAKMIQMSNFHATRGHSTHVHDPMATGYTNPYHKQRSAEKIVGESRMNVNVAPHMKQQVVLSLKIPAIAPSFQCPIMNANYSLTVKMDAQGLLGTSLKCEFPLIIGTIPIRQTVLPAGSASSSTVPAALPMKVVSSGSPYPVMGEGSSAGPVYPSAPPSTVFPSAPAYPGMGQGASVYPSAPSAPSAPPDSPTFGGAGISTVAAPPSYEETMHSGGVSHKPFVPSYPVYQNLEQSMAPPLPEKPGGF